jgi:hypothetical protein
VFPSKPGGKDNVIMNLPCEAIPARIVNGGGQIPRIQVN